VPTFWPSFVPSNPINVAGMARFSVAGHNLLGIPVVQLRAIAKRTGSKHVLAEELRASGVFEARIVAAFVAEPAKVTRRQANAWAKEFECRA
jgi:3-methyladenine DNA glycosylase AlkD